MKKIILILIVMACCVTVAYAEDSSFESMSNAELFDLRMQIDSVIASREDYKNGIIYSGKYICGEDIKAGVYDITTIKVIDGYYYVYVRIDHNDGREYDHYDMWPETTCTFELIEGDILTIEYGTCLLSESLTVNAFWRP